MYYASAELPLQGKSSVFIAIKPQGATLYRQIEIPLGDMANAVGTAHGASIAAHDRGLVERTPTSGQGAGPAAFGAYDLLGRRATAVLRAGSRPVTGVAPMHYVIHCGNGPAPARRSFAHSQ